MYAVYIKIIILFFFVRPEGVRLIANVFATAAPCALSPVRAREFRRRKDAPNNTAIFYFFFDFSPYPFGLFFFITHGRFPFITVLRNPFFFFCLSTITVAREAFFFSFFTYPSSGTSLKRALQKDKLCFAEYCNTFYVEMRSELHDC